MLTYFSFNNICRCTFLICKARNNISMNKMSQIYIRTLFLNYYTMHVDIHRNIKNVKNSKVNKFFLLSVYQTVNDQGTCLDYAHFH